MDKASIEKAKEHFGQLMEQQLGRVERMKAGEDWVDFEKVKPIRIGILGGDGIGPFIAEDGSDYLFQSHSDTVAGRSFAFDDVISRFAHLIDDSLPLSVPAAATAELATLRQSNAGYV